MDEVRAAELAADGAVGVDEAAAFLGLGRTNMYSLMKSGELLFVNIGARRLIPRVELRRYLAAQLMKPAAPPDAGPPA